jgi:CRP-like cAMP-binding protein
MKKLTETLNSFDKLSGSALDSFFAKMSPFSIQKGHFLIKENTTANYLYFIESGMVRSFYFSNHKEITISFSLAGEFITSMSSFIKQEPGYENIEALEDSDLFQIHYKDLQDLFENNKDLEHIYRLLLEQYYVKLEEQLIFSRFKKAKERYLVLLKENPLIIQKASVSHIASYLDMSLETLSRIRASI